MKKLALTLTALAAFTGSAIAADLPARTYSKAPMLAAAPSWTGFYLTGGGGYGMFDSNNYDVGTFSGAQLTPGSKVGGDGYFGTVGGGYDWQMNSWVVGVFADAQFGSIKGSLQDPLFGRGAGIFGGTTGDLKNRTSAAAGVRLGYLIAPNVLSYVNGGYSYAEFSGTTQRNIGGFDVSTTPAFNRNGWFVGGGVENQLNMFGLSPGWFMKTEYRVAEYQRTELPETFLPIAGVGLVGLSVSAKPIVQTVSTSLVYRFNWLK